MLKQAAQVKQAAKVLQALEAQKKPEQVILMSCITEYQNMWKPKVWMQILKLKKVTDILLLRSETVSFLTETAMF
ncbi:hypothetical protein SDC9_130775 [bioreactor metagenome]|uniref:Uncharacterized protein n=1 Tax=bioreactor metagenome TaxID=1076179 RepID=A0A645D2W9_9ZZZZ